MRLSRSPKPALLCAFLSAAAVLGCQRTLSEEQWVERIRAAATANPPLTIELGKSVGPLEFGLSKAEVRTAFGEPTSRSGPDAWNYPLRGLSVVFDKEGRLNVVHAGAGCPPYDVVLAEAFTGRTGQGIGMRSSRDQVLSALGEPSSSRTTPEGAEILRYRSHGLELVLQGGAVNHMSLWRPAT